MAAAAAGAPASDDDDDPAGNEGQEPASVPENEILVIGTSLKGEVDVPQKAVQTFDEEDIAAYGVSSIGELIDAIAPQTGSGRGRGNGRPVILLSGQRISSFREMRQIPPEAIRRMQILPEEVALRFGYPPNQRVVNIILKDKFSAVTADGEYNLPTRGGYSNYEAQAGLFRIDGPSRSNLSAKITESSLLTEAERDITPNPAEARTVASDPDPARYRSLSDASREIVINGTSTRALGEGGLDGSITVNGSYTRTDTRGLQGLDAVTLSDGTDTAYRTLADPRTTRTGTDLAEAGAGYARQFGAWQFNVTADGSYSDSTTRTDRRRNLSALQDAAAAGELAVAGPLPELAGAGTDSARIRNLSLDSLATLTGKPFRMPAGDAQLTAKAGYSFSRSLSNDTRTDLDPLRLTRGDVQGGLNLALPLTSKRYGVLGGVGDLSLNLSGGLDRLSDFGTLFDWSAGFTWSPTSTLTFQASYIVDQAAPTLAQLGAPQVVSNGVTVYDFVQGRSALVSVITGGNPDLVKEKRRDIKLSATWDLPLFDRSNLLVEYFRNRSSDVSESFPLLTPAVEAAFPDRVTRAADGTLIAIDRRAVTFDAIASSSIRWGFNIGGKLGNSGGDEGRGGRGGRMEGGGGFGGGPGGGPGRGGRGSRWNLSVYHTWTISDRVRIAPGTPWLDQLVGEALTAGGVPRHEIEMEGGLFANGLGARLKGTWSAPSRVDGSGAPGSSDLRFGSTFDLGLRLFVDFDRRASLIEKMPFLKGARLSFTVDNLLDSRQRVTDETGATPYAYQRAFREPQGRVIGIDLRKMF
ncbi:TonB-dependent receptor [Novosphingobium colocasiae]|uniref:TonB-dependent receptor n=2 Tax=Bacteria TaxID=2 RepID=A0A918PBJ0_9SPHN|nr:TonB-dependent receptor [Novosphingobium colocasiae]GGY96816.1 TonB-dependent receptor [Novosphingobium colocasiae]